MTSRALLAAGVAAALLAVSVGLDLAFARTLTTEVSVAGEWRETSRTSLDSEAPLPLEKRWREPEPIARDATLTIRFTLRNGYPWPTSETLEIQPEGCYLRGDPLETVRLSAGAGSAATAQVDLPVEDILAGGFERYPRAEPVPGSSAEPIEYATVWACRGQREVAHVSVPVQGASA